MDAFALAALLSCSLPNLDAAPSGPDGETGAELLDRLEARLATPAARAEHPFVVLRGTFTVAGMNFEGSFEERHAPPRASGGHERVIVKSGMGAFGESSQGTDGHASWMTDPGLGVFVARGDEQGGARRMWALSRSAPWRESYADARVVGPAERAGRAVLELELSPRGSSADPERRERWFVDPEGPELVAAALKLPNPTGGALPMEFEYGEWTEVEGIRYAQVRVQRVGAMAITYRVEAIEHPASLDDEALAPSEVVRAKLAEPGAGQLVPDEPEACRVRELEPRAVASVRATVDASKVSAELAVMLPEVMNALAEQGVQPAGPPFSRYHRIDAQANTIDLEAGIPVAAPIEALGRVQPGELPGGRAATTWHVGSYHELARTYARLEAWMKEQGLEARGPFWEVYWTDPGIEPDPADWKTEVLWPIQP